MSDQLSKVDKPAPNWCPRCHKRPDDVTFCTHEFHRIESAAAPVEVDEGLDSECQMHREMHFRIDGIVMGTGAFEVVHDGDQREAWENTVAAVATLARQLAEAQKVALGIQDERIARRQAESALAAATRRVAEVEEVLRQIDAYHGPIRTPIHTITKLRGMARAALNDKARATGEGEGNG